MELIIFVLALAFVSIASFWITGSVYGLIHRPAIYFPVTLATKMAAGALFGTFFMGIGGIVLATVFFNGEMQKRLDYKQWPTIISGVVMSVLCSVVIYFAVLGLAWEIFD